MNIIQKKISKSSTDSVLSGVCGGIAKRLKIKSWIIRSIFLLSTILFVFPLFIYLALTLILPKDKEIKKLINEGEFELKISVLGKTLIVLSYAAIGFFSFIMWVTGSVSGMVNSGAISHPLAVLVIIILPLIYVLDVLFVTGMVIFSDINFTTSKSKLIIFSPIYLPFLLIAILAFFIDAVT